MGGPRLPVFTSLGVCVCVCVCVCTKYKVDLTDNIARIGY